MRSVKACEAREPTPITSGLQVGFQSMRGLLLAKLSAPLHQGFASRCGAEAISGHAERDLSTLGQSSNFVAAAAKSGSQANRF